MMDILSSILDTLIFGGIGLIGFFGKRYYDKRDAQRKAIHAISAELEVQDLLNEFVYDNKVDRICLSAATNSGAVITIGTNRLVSVYFEALTTLPPIKQDFQKYPATDSFMRVMQQTAVSGEILKVDSRTYEPSDRLRQIYEAADIVIDYVGFIKYRELKNKNDELLFIDCHFSEDLTLDEEIAFLGNYQVLIDKLKKVM